MVVPPIPPTPEGCDDPPLFFLLFQPESEDFCRGGACQLKMLVPPTKTQGPPVPSPPLEKILAAPLLNAILTSCKGRNAAMEK